jgi:subtilisin family serine protease
MVKRSVGYVIVAVSSVAFAWTLRAQDLRNDPRASLAAPTNLSEATISIDNRGTALVTDGPATHPSRVLVRFRNGAAPVFLPGSAPAIAFPGDGNLHLVNTPPGLSVFETVRRYQANPNVLYAEPDYVVQIDSVPTDPGWNQQWDMVKIAAPMAWNTQTDSSTLVIAIIDTGINFKHPDLQANLWTNSDGSHGFTCMRGRCAKGGDDDYGHGTHVAGTIGAAANNGIGIAGLNWHAKLMSVKFLDANGSGNISDAVLAFDQVTALKQQGVNVRLTNNSWGSGGFSQALKDAMARAEAAGILHVCAAGNSGQLADSSPMYPAAYDNRGIVSVLASDQNDVGASFTNYGLGSVDIAAPGVSTYSTVPTGSCALCDKSGYKLLSGTSMATPHVTGVLAGLFVQNPQLSAIEARDVVLDPGSYDALTEAKAKSTSTGGRLNFAKALANPDLFSPVLNTFPTLSIGDDVFTSSGGKVTLAATAADTDGDPLRMSWSRSQSGSPEQWLFGWMVNRLFPTLDGTAASFTAPSIGRTIAVPYAAAVADGRGGSAFGREWVTVAGGNAGQSPSGSLTVSPTDAPAGSTITVNYSGAGGKNSQTGWDVWLTGQNASRGLCCFTGSSTTVKLDTPGVYRVSAQAIDQSLNLSNRDSEVVRIGGATGQPPIAVATLDKLSGAVPFTVNVNASGSTDPDGSVRAYYFGCGDGSMVGSKKAEAKCSFTVPGTYWIRVMVADSSDYTDVVSAYVVATP